MTIPASNLNPPPLGAYAATQCPRRTHNDFDETIPKIYGEVEFSPEVQARVDAGIEFDALIRGRLAQALPNDSVDITERGLFDSEAIAATVAAMDAGVAVILGGQLPHDQSVGRRGKPDVLIRTTNRPDGSHAYLPVDIKSHKVFANAKGSASAAVISRLTNPAHEQAVAIAELTGRRHEKDALQLAHYWRMLQACERAPDYHAVGGIIGTDDFDGDYAVLWHDLERRLFKTFSRSSEDGQSLRSAMERYDHEFAFRSEVAAVARSRTGDLADPEPLVEPVYIRECDDCPWFDYCIDQLGEQDASAGIGRLSAREWLTLRSLGYLHVEDIASLDLDVIDGSEPVPDTASAQATVALLDQYLPEVGHIQNPRRRLRGAVMAAGMVLNGTHLRRVTQGPIEVPRADIEIDFDIESDRETRVYLWGLLITDHAAGTSHFEHVSTWEELDEEAEAELAARFWQRLTEVIGTARREGKSALIYHYASPEPNNLRRIAATGLVPDVPTPAEVDSMIKETFIDMYPIMRANYFGRDGLGLKVTATKGAGFSWRDEDPGGLQSISWLEQVRDGEHELKQRILEYNEDDVRATLALREWLTNE